MRYNLLVLIIFLVQFSSCSLDPVVIDSDSTGYYYVESILSPNLSMQGVIVGKTIPEHLPENVSNAIVIITGADQSVKLIEDKPGIYLDKYQNLRVFSGAKYFLTVYIPDGPTISGAVYIPSVFEILFPTQRDTVEYEIKKFNGDTQQYPGNPYFYPFIVDTLKLPRLIWSRSKNALVYKIQSEFNDEMVRGSYGYTATIDTNIYFPDIFPVNIWNLPDTMKWEKDIQIKLRITAYDSNQIITNFEPRSYWSWDSSVINMLNLIENRNYKNKTPNMIGGKGFLGAFTMIEKNIVLKVKMKWP